MARRTRRPAVVWLPLSTEGRIGTVAGATTGTDSASFFFAVNTPGFGGTAGTQVLPMVKDEPQGIAGQAETLSDLEGSAYRLRRIVGKLFIQPEQIAAAAPTDATSFLITAGFIILRVDGSGTVLSGAGATYDTQILDNTRDPWIWRRSWMLSNQAGINALNIAVPDSKILIFPSSTINGYGGGVADGPHVDAKTARVVSDEERLFLVVSALPIDGTDQIGNATQVAVFGEVRVLASMRKQSGNRRNASR